MFHNLWRIPGGMECKSCLKWSQNMTRFLGGLTKIEICDIVYVHRLCALFQYRLSNYIASFHIFLSTKQLASIKRV